MWSFLICGIVLLIFAWKMFHKKILYPSIVFSLMWGLNCIFHVLIYEDLITPLTDKSLFDYQYMDTYIIYFTIATVLGFYLSHVIYKRRRIHIEFSLESTNRLLKKYRWILWLNFWGGILRFVALVSYIGFSFSNVIDYRLAANSLMMVASDSLVGWIFRLTAYVNLFAIFYVAISGLSAGMTNLKIKDTLKLFLLFSPVQMATGGRLFILYFIIFYFGSFFLGRGIIKQIKSVKLLQSHELKAIVYMMIIMMPLVVAISLARGEGGVSNISKYEGSFLDSFSYICDGTMTSEQGMAYFDGGNSLNPAGGQTTFIGSSPASIEFSAYQNCTSYASSVSSIISPIFFDFGYIGSLIAWAVIVFVIESTAIICLSKLTLIKFAFYAMLLKMCYESVITNPIANNIAFIELLILIYIAQFLFRKS